MPVTGISGEHLRMDEHLEQFMAGIVERIGFDPPDIGIRLRPPKLGIVRGEAQGAKSFTATVRGISTIVLGGSVYSSINQYCRAAATYFIREPRGARRRSRFWRAARDSLATSADWAASPSTQI